MITALVVALGFLLWLRKRHLRRALERKWRRHRCQRTLLLREGPQFINDIARRN